MIIVNGKQIANNLLDKLKLKIDKLKLKPRLAAILVGNNKASLTYVRRKQEAAETIGVRFSLYRFSESIVLADLVQEINLAQKEPLDGIIVQLPLPKHLDKKTILNQLKPEIDVDFLTWVSLGKLLVGHSMQVPPAAGAILEILKRYRVRLDNGKHVVIVGQGDLIGKPLTTLLVKLPVTLTVCNKETHNLGRFTSMADILITGVGQPGLITKSMVKKGAVVIDAGVSFEKEKMRGDVDFAQVAKVASLITPTPGGVGPITVAKLLENTVAVAMAKRL